MSGNNQHGRLGQPNASYNQLQVPFIPRQPQLAHVHMNDSILRSSPLDWHQSDTAFLNYMTTQHKAVGLLEFIQRTVNFVLNNTSIQQPLELNPLAFVRPPVANSFGTIDLSFPTNHRPNLTPPPHNTNNTSVPNNETPPLEFPSSLQYSSKSMLSRQDNLGFIFLVHHLINSLFTVRLVFQVQIA